MRQRVRARNQQRDPNRVDPLEPAFVMIDSSPNSSAHPPVASPTHADHELVELGRASTFPPRVGVRFVRSEQGRAGVGSTHADADADGHRAALHASFASGSRDFVDAEVNALGRVASEGFPHFGHQELNASLAIVAAAEPQNELETALAVNAAAAHQQALRMLARVDDESRLASAAYASAAAKLMRAFAEHVGAPT
jgi:hypothetical protein